MVRILLVDDDDAVRGFVARALTMDSHVVEEARDGEEALNRFSGGNNSYGLVLSDIQMPAMDGIALAKTLARVKPGQKMLLMTGYCEQRENAAEIEPIIVDVVAKPFSLIEIRKRVNEALAA